MTSRIWIMLVGITAVVALAIGLTIAMPGQKQSIVHPATASAATSDGEAVVSQENSTEPVVESVIQADSSPAVPASETDNVVPVAQVLTTSEMEATLQQGAGNQLSLIDIAAQELGMTRAELVAELQAGKSILNVADERGVAIETILEAFITARSAWLDTLVANGQMTREFADSRLAQMRAMVPAQLNQAGLPQGYGQGMGPGNGQGMGPGNGQGRGNGGQGQGQGRGNGGQGQGQGPGQGTGTCQGPNMVDTNNNGICDYREQP